MEVSVYKRAKNVDAGEVYDLEVLHGYIVGNRGLKEATAQVRAAPDKQAANVIKLKALPVMTVHGVLPNRKKDRKVRVNEWSGLIQADVDTLPEGVSAEELRDQLFQDPAVALAFVSPRGEGVKLAVAVDEITNLPTYKAAFAAVQAHFRQKHNLEIDGTCKDDSRCCYLCHDAGAQYRSGLFLEPLQNLDIVAAAAETSITETLASLTPVELKDHATNIALYRKVVAADKGAVEGESGDAHTLQLAMKGRDYGLTPSTVLGILRDEWNDRCEPPWSEKELYVKVQNAFAYASSAPGTLSIPDSFDVVEMGENEAWTENLRRKKGAVQATVHNTMLILRNDRFVSPKVAWDDFRSTVVWAEVPAWSTAKRGDPVNIDEDGAHLRALLSDLWNIEVTKQDLVDTLIVLAQAHRFHPLRESIAVLKWDGVSRVDRLFTDYIKGGGDKGYRVACGKVLLLSAVARAFEPGCKSDQMVVLEGPQGSFKSTAIKTLFSPFYLESAVAALGSKDFVQAIQGGWVIELPELDSLSRSDANTIKSVLSNGADVARMPYGRSTKTYPRQCILVGTTNDSAYLRDNTGNRRFLPVRADQIDLDALKRDRDQLIAEAYQLYKDGEAWYLQGDMEALARAEADKRRIVDPWEYTLSVALPELDADEVTWSVLQPYLHIKGAPRPADSARLSGVMQALGWVNVGGLTWRRPGAYEEEVA